jgi:hypothetical protein
VIHAAQYRQRAEDCARKALDAQDEFHKRNFSELAAMWAEMADKAEGRRVFIEEMDKRAFEEKKALTDALTIIQQAKSS